MATFSEVKAGLDEIANVIRDNRAVMMKVKSNAAERALASAESDAADAAALKAEWANKKARLEAAVS